MMCRVITLPHESADVINMTSARRRWSHSSLNAIRRDKPPSESRGSVRVRSDSHSWLSEGVAVTDAVIYGNKLIWSMSMNEWSPDTSRAPPGVEL